MKTFKIMVTGSRHHTDADLIWGKLDEIVDNYMSVFGLEPVILYEGGYRGSDAIAREWAEERRHRVVTFPALWDKYGRAAGPRRNQAMVDAAPDVVLAFPLGGSIGTLDAIKRAQHAGIHVWVWK